MGGCGVEWAGSRLEVFEEIGGGLEVSGSWRCWRWARGGGKWARDGKRLEVRWI